MSVMWHLRARDLHPSLGRFLSADPVQPNAPGTQGYNRYAYVANNPTALRQAQGKPGSTRRAIHWNCHRPIH
ncbi:MAG: RHS repeat-associated core domain-containing protein [Caldilineaceae bacterium]